MIFGYIEFEFVQFIQSAKVKRFGVRGGLMRHMALGEGYN